MYRNPIYRNKPNMSLIILIFFIVLLSLWLFAVPHWTSENCSQFKFWAKSSQSVDTYRIGQKCKTRDNFSPAVDKFEEDDFELPPPTPLPTDKSNIATSNSSEQTNNSKISQSESTNNCQNTHIIHKKDILQPIIVDKRPHINVVGNIPPMIDNVYNPIHNPLYNPMHGTHLYPWQHHDLYHDIHRQHSHNGHGDFCGPHGCYRYCGPHGCKNNHHDHHDHHHDHHHGTHIPNIEINNNITSPVPSETPIIS